MLQITHPEIFSAIVEEAKHRAGGEERWVHAIDRAAEEMTTSPFFTWMGTYMLIQSPDSAEVYEANGVCQCRAFDFHKPCWHRAAARLWKRYLERVTAQESRPADAEASALLVAPAARRVERVRGLMI